MVQLEIAPGKFIGDGHPTFVIAEAGINHQGQVKIAKELIDLAVESGADCVKFQKRTSNKILTKAGLAKPYDNPNSFGPTYGEHREALELNFDQWKELKKYSDEKGILFSASGWDEDSVDFLDELGIPFYKVASADLTNFPLLKHTALKKKPMIMSTGMSDMETVKIALEYVKQFTSKIVLLQCTSTYPTPIEELNLKVIETYKKEFPELVIGYSGHEKGVAISLSAVVLGAKVIERHFTLDRTMKGGDHAASLEPSGIKHLIRDIRFFEQAYSDGIKRKYPGEEGPFKKLSKSLVTTTEVKKGTVLSREMIYWKSPGTGISPMNLEKVIGKKVTRDIGDDEVINEEDVEW